MSLPSSLDLWTCRLQHTASTCWKNQQTDIKISLYSLKYTHTCTPIRMFGVKWRLMLCKLTSSPVDITLPIRYSYRPLTPNVSVNWRPAVCTQCASGRQLFTCSNYGMAHNAHIGLYWSPKARFAKRRRCRLTHTSPVDRWNLWCHWCVPNVHTHTNSLFY